MSVHRIAKEYFRLDNYTGKIMIRKKVAAPPSGIVNHEIDEQQVLASRGRTLVFISHDSRDADLAEAFANLLSDVSAGTLKSFRSSDKKGTSGIEFGTEWYKAIMSQLGDAVIPPLLTDSKSGAKRRAPISASA